MIWVGEKTSECSLSQSMFLRQCTSIMWEIRRWQFLLAVLFSLSSNIVKYGRDGHLSPSLLVISITSSSVPDSAFPSCIEEQIIYISIVKFFRRVQLLFSARYPTGSTHLTSKRPLRDNEGDTNTFNIQQDESLSLHPKKNKKSSQL